ncbi:hypothetical protein [Nocardiopsis sp. NPDC006938]|uniref:hypothetical protein n=1 Tax=Nocardiopsis sp. NPDC006938 TaxID=3364337 RepID=UPI0036A92166
MTPRVEPVLELPDGAFLPLADTSPETFLGVWADYNRAASPHDLLRQEMTLVPGGLRATGPDGTVVNPGCCCGMEDWRDWLLLVERERIWMGHDPGVNQAFADNGVLLSQEGSKATVLVPLPLLPVLLEGVRERMLGLLAGVGLEAGPEVAALLDRDLHVTAPLPLRERKDDGGAPGSGG